MRLVIAKIMSIGDLSSAKSSLANVRGVQSVDQKSFKDGTADIDLRLDGGDTEAFAGDLDGKQLGKMKVKVVGYTPNTVNIELVK